MGRTDERIRSKVENVPFLLSGEKYQNKQTAHAQIFRSSIRLVEICLNETNSLTTSF